MAESTQEVKARLSVETEGDAAAFQTAAQGVSSLASSAASAAPPLSSIAAELARLGDSVKGIGPAGESFQRFSEALERFTQAKGVEEQRKALDEALEAWKEFGDRVPEVLDKSSSAAKEFQGTLEALEAQQRKLGDPLVQSVEKARTALKNLNESVEGSFDGAEGKLVKARHSIDEYRRSLEEAKEAGKGISSDQVAELDRLENEYGEATRAVASYAKAKSDAKKDIEAAAAATQNEVGQIGSLRDIAEKASPSLGKLVGVGAAMVGAFTAGYAAGEKLRNILNDLTTGALDRFIQKSLGVEAVAGAWERFLNALSGGTEDATRQLEELANQRRAFEKLGIEGFSADLEKNAEILARHSRAIHDNNAVLEEFAKKIGLSRVELASQAAELVRSITAFHQANAQIDPNVFRQIVKDQIQPLLDAYERLGVDAPAALKRLAAQWSVTTSTVEDAAKKHASAVQLIVSHIVGISNNTVDELKQVASAVSAAVAELNTAKLDPQGLERARLEVKTMIDAFRAVKEEIPAALIAAADKVQVFVAPIERAGGAVQIFAGKTAEAADATVVLRRTADGLKVTMKEVAESAKQMGTDVEAGRKGIETVTPVAGAAQISLEALKAKYGETGWAAKTSGEGVSAAGEALQAAGSKAMIASHPVQAVGAALAAAGVQASGASQPLEEAGKATKALEDGAKKAGESVGALGTGIAGVKEGLDGLEGDVAAVVSILSRLGTVKFADAIIADLERVREAVRQLKADMLEVQQLIGEETEETFELKASH